jgi:hypothetical protein
VGIKNTVVEVCPENECGETIFLKEERVERAGWGGV